MIEVYKMIMDICNKETYFGLEYNFTSNANFFLNQLHYDLRFFLFGTVQCLPDAVVAVNNLNLFKTVRHKQLNHQEIKYNQKSELQEVEM